MCGIVGIIGLNARVSAELLERATRSLAHRGPDDGGTVILHDFAQADEEIEIGLGNRRLAILDLSPLGHQPMNDPATGNWIVYNGEVYNFREVRTELEKAGLQFNSLSDTEVILKAYTHWGKSASGNFVACLRLPSGMRSGSGCSLPAILWESSRFITTSRNNISFFFGSPNSAWNWSRAARHRFRCFN